MPSKSSRFPVTYEFKQAELAVFLDPSVYIYFVAQALDIFVYYACNTCFL